MTRNFAAALAAGVCVVAIAAPAQAQTREYRIPAGSLKAALDTYARQSGRQVIYKVDDLRGVRSPGVTGQLTPEGALNRILAGTGFSARSDSSGAVAIVRANFDRDQSMSNGGPVELARNATVEPEEQQIVVTGTNIRGVEPAGQKLIVVGRDDIEKSGYSSAQELIRSLPQSFRGDTRGDNFSNDAGNLRPLGNNVNSEGVDLRGFGAGATLTLVNGRRLAPSGLGAAISDVSVIPLAAVDRVEILADGASALYGADAVGGVVNFILRKSFDGAETRLRYGNVTDSPRREIQLSQALGRSWQTGSILLGFDLLDTTALLGRHRERTRGDHRKWGGRDNRINQCNPGTLIVGGVSYALPANQNGMSLNPNDLVPNSRNRCSVNEVKSLLPETQNWSGIARLSQELAPGLSIFADGIYAERKGRNTSPMHMTLDVPSTNPFYVNPTGGTENVIVEYDMIHDIGAAFMRYGTKTLNTAFGVEVDLGGGWNLTGYTAPTRQSEMQFLQSQPDPTVLAEVLADSRPDHALNPFGDGSSTNPATIARLRNSTYIDAKIVSKAWSNNVIVNGPIVAAPGGDVRVAIGADHRDLKVRGGFDYVIREANVRIPFPSDFDREVVAGFGELFIPVVGDANARPGLYRLNFSLAGRYEHYDDFGSNFSPRIGAVYAPIRGIRARGSWGRSFKAPGVSDLSTNTSGLAHVDMPDPLSPTGSSTTLSLSGGNPHLRPETARTWSVGIDIDGSLLGGLSISASYFNTAFRDRIAYPPEYSLSPVNGPAVIRNPTAEQITDACASAPYAGNFSSQPGDCLTTPTVAIRDGRLTNLARLNASGLDVLLDYATSTRFGTINAGLNATYLFDYTIQATSASEPYKALNTVDDPLRFKARGSVGWLNDGWSITGFVNFANSYKNEISNSQTSIGSWTTLDVNLSYDLGLLGIKGLGGTKMSLNARNLFDKQAPFVDWPDSLAAGFDATNADIIGRVISISIRKAW